MQMVGSSVKIEWLVGSPEDGFGAGGPVSVERRMAQAGGEVCPKSKVFGVVGVGKGAKMDPKRLENIKLLARISGYLRLLAHISGFGRNIGVLPDGHSSGGAMATRVMGRGGYSAHKVYQELPVIPLNSG
jgi:hypothetical protein